MLAGPFTCHAIVRWRAGVCASLLWCDVLPEPPKPKSIFAAILALTLLAVGILPMTAATVLVFTLLALAAVLVAIMHLFSFCMCICRRPVLDQPVYEIAIPAVAAALAESILENTGLSFAVLPVAVPEASYPTAMISIVIFAATFWVLCTFDRVSPAALTVTVAAVGIIYQNVPAVSVLNKAICFKSF